MRRYIETYKGYDIYYEDGIEYTVSNTFWIVVNGSHEIWLYGDMYSLRDVEKYLDEITNPIAPEPQINITIKYWNDTVTVDKDWYNALTIDDDFYRFTIDDGWQVIT